MSCDNLCGKNEKLMLFKYFYEYFIDKKNEIIKIYKLILLYYLSLNMSTEKSSPNQSSYKICSDGICLKKIHFIEMEEKLFRSGSSGKILRYTYDYKIKQTPQGDNYTINEKGHYVMKINYHK